MNNADFARPADGMRPRMRIFLWNRAQGAQCDGDFNAGVVLYEYTHGLSTRLTGGPSRSTCLNTNEAGGMGEGWSNFFPTAISLKPGDTRATNYGVGNFVYGIRRYPYSTSMTTNPTLYSTINRSDWNEIHAIEVFPQFRPGNSIPTKGRQLAMKLVLQGMKLQPCNPTFLTARGAILDADRALTKGKNLCELWKGFAKRGIGSNASQGARPNQRVDGFRIPDGVCK
ncbi:hypothetical protein RUND412_004796 [Rhizina undulata]